MFHLIMENMSRSKLICCSNFGFGGSFESFTQRKSKSQKHNPSKLQKLHKTAGDVAEPDEPGPSGYDEDHPPDQRPKRAKRPTKSVNENLEPAYNSAANMPVNSNSFEYQLSSHDYHTGNYRADLQEDTPS